MIDSGPDQAIAEAKKRAWRPPRREAARPSRLKAIREQRCPRCRQGGLFRRGLRMNDYCPVCCLRFEREPGYFSVAVALAQLLSIVFLSATVLVLERLFRGYPAAFFGAALAIYVPWVPAIVRLSRTLWIHWDRALDP